MYQENIKIGDFEFFRAEIINPQIDSMDSIQSSIPSMQDDFCRQNEEGDKVPDIDNFSLRWNHYYYWY